MLLDVPGLVEGASQGKGLGLEFLRHVERVRAIVQLVDGTGAEPAAECRQIATELESYTGGLVEKPRVVVINKVDVPEVQERLAELLVSVKNVCGSEPLAISAATGEGVGDLLDRLLQLVPEEPETAQHAPLRLEPEEPRRLPRVTVTMEDDVYVVTCRQVERFAPMVDFTNWRAKLQFHRELERNGVIEALEKKGVEPGDTVRIAGRELEWQ